MVSTALATTAQADIIRLASGGDLGDAIASARGGDTIELQRGAVFSGKFSIRDRNFSEDKPLVIRSASGSGAPAQIKGTGYTSGTALTIADSSHIVVDDVRIHDSLFAVKVKRSDHLIFQDIKADTIGQEAFLVRYDTSHVDVLDCVIRDTGKRTAKYGEAIYIGGKGASDNPGDVDETRNIWVEGCDISETGNGEAVDISGTSSNVMIKGNYLHDITTGTKDKPNQGLVTMAHQDGNRSNTGGSPVTYTPEPRNVWIVENTIRRQRRSANPYNQAGIYVNANGVNIVGNDIDETDDFAILATEFRDSRFDVNVWDNAIGGDIGKSPAIKRSNTDKQNLRDPGQADFGRQTWYGGGGTDTPPPPPSPEPDTGDSLVLDAWRKADKIVGGVAYDGFGIGNFDARSPEEWDYFRFKDIDFGDSRVARINVRYGTLDPNMSMRIMRVDANGKWRKLGELDLPTTSGLSDFEWTGIDLAEDAYLSGRQTLIFQAISGWGSNISNVGFDMAGGGAPDAGSYAIAIDAWESDKVVGANTIGGYGVTGCNNNDAFRFKNVDFGATGATRITLDVGTKVSSMPIDVFYKDEAVSNAWNRLGRITATSTGN